MDVLGEILTWSKDRPDWQRDALRRLVLNHDLTEADLDVLTEICKSAHGLAPEQDVVPLGKEHLPTTAANAGKVTVQSIYHKRGVNALAPDQTLAFGSGLTVVYGDNGAGKSGYTRIFKSACRARGAEDILGNVLSGATPLTPIVTITYMAGDQSKEWPRDGDDAIARVSIFDRYSEAVYTTQKTDVAFRPFGLDLFDKLAKACNAIRRRLEREQQALGSTIFQIAGLPEDTTAAKFIARLSSLTKPEEVKSIGTLTDQETERLALLEKQLLDLQVNDPAKVRQELTLRVGRLRTLVRHLKDARTGLSHSRVDALFEARKAMQSKQTLATALRDAAFSPDLLTGTGSEIWSAMWEAARLFSRKTAYPDRLFPVIDARCVLCQQDIGEKAAIRLSNFETFVASVAEQDLRSARRSFEELEKVMADLKINDSATQQLLADLRIEDESLSDDVAASHSFDDQLRASIFQALGSGKAIPETPSTSPVVDKVDSLVNQLDERIKGLQTETTGAVKNALTSELKELKARKMLGAQRQNILKEIEGKTTVAAYSVCIDDTKTQAITVKSTAVTKVAVTQQLKTTFKEELKKLKFRHVEVELTEAGGESGSLYHKLILTRAPGVDLPKVVSEGEARCLSIAAFFAELSTAEDPSAIAFDDPVSSFDYKWREGVALRLVEEAKKRQVIVFTHDIVFLLLLQKYADQRGVERLDQHVRQLQIGAGVCEAELPWVALPVKKRLGVLRKRWQDADKLFRNGQQSLYETEAAYLYGLLREAWERGLEEVLLGGIVERYRSGVQTQQIEVLSDITIEDCKAVENAMTKCSQWLPGHDQAPAARQDLPAPDELKTDIEALDVWATTIRKRRQ